MVLFRDEDAVGESLSCQLADGGSGIKDSLLARFHGVGKLAVIALQIESFQALKPGYEPGFGQLGQRFVSHCQTPTLYLENKHDFNAVRPSARIMRHLGLSR